jgi:hypothetical protein
MQKRGQELRNVQHFERKGVNKPFRKTRRFGGCGG